MCHIVLGVEHIIACALKLLLLQRPHVASRAWHNGKTMVSMLQPDGFIRTKARKFEERGGLVQLGWSLGDAVGDGGRRLSGDNN